MSIEEGGYPVHDDPVVQLLAVMVRSLSEWPPKPQAEGEWDPTPYLPGGSRYIPKLTTHGTPVTPTMSIPFADPAEERREAAAKALAVLRGASPPVTRPTLAGKPCAQCAFRPRARPQLPRFPLPPFEPYEPHVPLADRLPYRIEFGLPWKTSAAIRLSGVVWRWAKTTTGRTTSRPRCSPGADADTTPPSTSPRGATGGKAKGA